MNTIRPEMLCSCLAIFNFGIVLCDEWIISLWLSGHDEEMFSTYRLDAVLLMQILHKILRLVFRMASILPDLVAGSTVTLSSLLSS